MLRRSLRAAFVVGLALAGCSDDGDAELPPLTTATTLACPRPGALPFRLETMGFQDPRNAELAASAPRVKDEASDTLGNPGGPLLSVHDPDTAAGGAAPHAIGSKARTGVADGVVADPLPGERVALWWFDGAAAAWHQLGATETDASGRYDLAIEPPPDQAPVFALLEADASCAAHYDYRYPPGTPVILTDIDGTLTLDDAELLAQLTDASYLPRPMGAARALVDAWAAKGYVIVYLTARPHLFRPETRQWLTALGFPPGPVITTNSESAGVDYKRLWVERLRTTFGWTITAAYGNAASDIEAYALGGIAKAVTFIVGPLGGQSGTVAIPGQDFSEHIVTYVRARPDA